MRSITKFLERQLKVKVNPDKSKVGSPLRLKFLRFSLGVNQKGVYARATFIRQAIVAGPNYQVVGYTIDEKRTQNGNYNRRRYNTT